MALIKCPECQKEISIYATACPNCGLPKEFFGKVDNSIVTVEKPKNEPKKKRTRHKLPNGYGYIKHLSGNRTKPYAAYPPSKEMNHKGTPLYKNPLGYFKTYNEAYRELVTWHENGEKEKRKEYTFSEVYELWFAEYCETHNSKSTLNAHRAAYKKCETLHNREIRYIYAKDLQKVMDSNTKGYSSNVQIHNLLRLMFKFADKNGMVDKNYAKYVENKKENDNELGIPFTEDDLRLLWKNKSKYEIQILLILCYTGLRINELRVTEVDLKEMTLTGGLKTQKGRERIVPIKEELKPFFKSLKKFKSESDQNYRNILNATLDELNLYTVGETNHTPHDARHTFSWLADKYEMETMCKYLIMGHSLGKDVDKRVYTHRTVDELRKEMNKIPIYK